MKYIQFFLIFLLSIPVFAQKPPKPYGEVPSKRQLAWHDLEMYGLVHFKPTTFQNKEWGYGDADPKTFNPTLKLRSKHLLLLL